MNTVQKWFAHAETSNPIVLSSHLVGRDWWSTEAAALAEAAEWIGADPLITRTWAERDDFQEKREHRR